MNQIDSMKDLNERTAKAVAHYWHTRAAQRRKQGSNGKADQGLRSAVAGGTQIDGFIDLFSEVIKRAGIPVQFIVRKKDAELPGFFNPTTKWDLIIVRDQRLLAAIKVESQAGPSFGNNFNNHTKDAMGRALDFWAAYREGAYLDNSQPFLGYFFMLEDCEAASRPIGLQEPHFKVLQGFVGSSYMRRYELFCRKLVLERHYTAAAFITSTAMDGLDGKFKTPAEDLSLVRFIKTLAAHAAVSA